MKKLFTVANAEGIAVSVSKTTITVLAGIALTSSLWVASLHIAQGARVTPAEMIQSKLPPNTTIGTATDPQLLEAVCQAVKQWPREAQNIVRTATGARKSLRADILCTAIRCLREINALDCTWVVDVVRDWIKADPSEANRLTELIIDCAPECRDPLQALLIGIGNFTNPPTNINAPPGSVGGGAGGNVCIVCHNNQEIQVACSDLENYLRNHPGDTAVACVVTSVTNQ
jgi:hypothetical protein